jgi:hypothetical protein
MGDVKVFPILGEPSLRSIPWEMIEAHEGQAQRNHQQSLTELARRSGLSPCEALCVLASVEWPHSWFGGVPKDLQTWTTAVLSAWAQQFTASNLRTLPNPTPDVADLVKRLRDEATEQIRVANHIDDDEMADSYFLGLRASHPSWQAADMLTLLQAQVAVARKMAVEECAGVCDAENTRLLSEARQTFGEEKYKKNYAAEWCAWLATTIRALTPPDPAGGMLEKVKEEGR